MAKKTNEELWNMILENDNLINDCIWKRRNTWEKFLSFEDVKSEYLLIIYNELDKVYNVKNLNLKPSTVIYNNIVIYNRIDAKKNKEYRHQNYIEYEELKNKI